VVGKGKDKARMTEGVRVELLNILETMDDMMNDEYWNKVVY
jgi:hypothetical protein